MKFIKNGILVFMLSGWGVLYAIKTAQDLTNTYNGIKTEISVLEKQLVELPASTQQNLRNQLVATAKQIDTTYKTTMKQIAPWQKEPNNMDALLLLNNAVTQAQQSINDLLYPINLKIAQAITLYQQQQQKKHGGTINYKKEEALIKAQEAYEQKMEVLFSKLMQLLPTYNQLGDNIQKFLNQLALGQAYKEATVEQLSAQLDALAQKAYDLYKQVMPIHADDRAQLLNNIIKRIGNLYNEIIFQNIQQIQKEPISNDYFKALVALSIKIRGTNNKKDTWLVRDGFDKSLQIIIAKYFDTSTDQQKMFFNYLQNKINATYVAYNNALSHLVIQAGSSPTQEQLSYALQIYTLIMDEIKQINEPSNTNDAARNANISLALLNANIGLSLMKSLQPNQNTEPMRQQIITYFKQASVYFSQASSTASAQNYIGLYTKLTQAGQLIIDAQNAYTNGDESKAISQYTTAQQYFLQAGDKVDANKVSITLSAILGNYAIKNGTALYNQFSSKNSALISEYITFINSLDTSVTMATFEPLFNDLISLYQNTYVTLAPAVQSYQSVIKNNPSLQQSAQTITLLQNLTEGVSLVTSLSQAQFNLMQGDEQLAGLSSQALLQADQYYEAALQLFGQADSLYEKNKQLASYLPYLFTQKGENIDFTTIAQRHIAKLGIQYANTLGSNPVLALMYYNDANTRFNYLTPAVDSFITTTLGILSKSTPSIAQLYANAQATEKRLQTLPASSWVSNSTTAYYSSDATVQWNNLLQQYLLIYHLGYMQAKDAFTNAITSYAALYQQKVPSSFFPEIGIALIQYMNYLLLLTQKEDTEPVIKEINQNITLFFNKATALLKTINDPTSLTTTATTDQETLMHWSIIADQAIQTEENVRESMGLSSTPLGTLLEKSVDSHGVITYNALTIKQTITMPNPSLQLASLYKQLGDLYLKQKNYTLAYPCYYQAKQIYLKENQPNLIASFNDQLAVANALYLATEYRDLIIPQGAVTINGIQIPDHYEIKVYGQAVPVEFTSGVDFRNLKTPQMVSDFLISLASKMYIYNKITEMFPGFDFDTLFPLFSLSYNQLINNSVFQSFIPDQQSAFISVLTNALLFNNELTKRVQAKISSLSLQPIGIQNGMPQYGLYEYYVPIPPFVDEITFYQNYPAVIEYYICAASLYRPADLSTANMQICQPSLPAGNDSEQYAAMIEAQVHTFLSQGYDFQKQLDSITTSTTWKALKQVPQTDMNITLDPYMALYNSIKNLYNQMIAYYNGPISSNLTTAQSKEYASIISLLLDSYKNCADTLATFLIGDPLSYNYTQVLKDMLGNYVMAIVTYKNSDDLYGTMAQYHMNAGMILTNQKKFFDSLSYFFTAVNLYQRITAPTDSIKKSTTQANVRYYGAMFKGSTNNLGSFQETQKGLIDIVLSTGATEKISFTDLMTKYLQFLSQQGGVSTVSLDPAEQDMAKKIQNFLLDAMIYYSGCNTLIVNHGAQKTDPSLLMTLIPDEGTRTDITQQALALLHTFTEKNQVALDDLTSVTITLNRTDFPDGKDFVTLMFNGFELFKEKIENASDVTTQAIGYSAIAQLSLKLYTFLEFLYMDIFLGGPSVNAETNLASDIQIEVNNILAPSNQYIG